jgi:hypothetical protein
MLCPLAIPDSLKYCRCHWLNVSKIFEEYVTTLDRTTYTKLYNAQWMKVIRRGEEMAVFGMLLTCTPNLRTLAIQKRNENRTFYGFTRWFFGLIDVSMIFGLYEECEAALYTKVPGLVKLQTLNDNCMLPPSFIKLPALITLDFKTITSSRGFLSVTLITSIVTVYEVRTSRVLCALS